MLNCFYLKSIARIAKQSVVGYFSSDNLGLQLWDLLPFIWKQLNSNDSVADLLAPVLLRERSFACFPSVIVGGVTGLHDGWD